MLWRIAVGLVRNRSPEHRWRRLAVPASAFLFMLLLLASSAVLALVDREQGRDSARSPMIASEPSPTDLLSEHGSDRWRGELISVVWLEPVDPEAVTVTPPGMRKFPAPGQAVVSPALDRLASRYSELALRYPNRVVLGNDGVGSGGELLAYVRPPAGRSLGDPADAVRIEDGRHVGTGPTRVAGFGQPGWLLIEPLPMWAMAAGLLGMLVVPGIMVLAVGMAAASSVRDQRFRVLRALGARSGALRGLAVLEGLMLAVPGIVAALLLWALLGRWLRTVPIVGHHVLPGDLGLPWWLLLAHLGVGTVLAAVVSLVVGRLGRLDREAGPRPAPRRGVLTAVAAVPYAAAMAAFLLGRTLGGEQSKNLYLMGAVGAVLGTPAIVPGALRAVGAFLGRLRPVLVSVTGRAIEWDPVRSARPFIGVAALVVLVLAGAGYVALGSYEDETRPMRDEAHVAAIQWPEPAPGDLPSLTRALGGALVAPYRQEEEGGAGEPNGALTVGVTCRQIAAYLRGLACDPRSPYALPAAAEARLARALIVAKEVPTGSVRLVAPESLGVAGRAIVLDRQPPRVLEQRVRTAAMTTLPAPQVESFARYPEKQSPLVAWLVTGMLLAAITLGIGCLLSLVDRLLAARRHYRHLLNLGMPPRQFAALGAMSFAVPYGVVLMVSFATGIAVSASIALPIVPVPWAAVAGVAVLAAVVGMVGAAGVAFLGARSALREPE